MSVTMARILLMACLLSPSLSWALGLGEIHLNSSLNEPMNAEIDLIAAAPDELTALRATLASREAFTRYGIDKPPFLSTLTFAVGKGKDGRDALLVRSTDSIPEPFVTFLVEVNWARGRLMREYTVLLDPPVYTPGENASSPATVAVPTTPAAPTVTRPAPVFAAPPVAQPESSVSSAHPLRPAGGSTVPVGRGDTLTKIARSLQGGSASASDLDQTMIALYRSNPEAFGGNINVLRQGAVLRVPDADQIAALNQKQAVSEVHRQLEAWRSAAGSAGASNGHLLLVTPRSGGSTTGTATGTAIGAPSNAEMAETKALKDRVKNLEGQLAESKRLIDIRSSELSALQRKLGVPVTPPPAAAKPPVAATPTPPAPAVTAPAAPSLPPTPAKPPEAASAASPPPVATVAPVIKPAVPATDTGSWIDWVSTHWWMPLALLVLAVGGLGFAAMRRRRQDQSDDMNRLLDDTDVAGSTERMSALRKGHESFVVEESGARPAPTFAEEPVRAEAESKSPVDTLSSESAVNLDQGDPLAEADFHMAYGLYDQAADLVRIALEREPDRRDLRLKLLEIYFVWGNKELFLQSAKSLESSKDRAPAGEWDKIVIMGKQICPEDPLFAGNAGGGRGAGAMVDLNLEGGENRVDIDLFGDPEGERSTLDHPLAKEGNDMAATGESPAMRAGSKPLDFTLDAPERGADDSPTHEMPPREEPTVESELMNFSDANFLDAPGAVVPTVVTPGMKPDAHDHIAGKLPTRADQTAEVSIDDLGLDLDHLDQLEQTGSTAIGSEHLEATDHPVDAPTMVAGLDERSRLMMSEAEKKARASQSTTHDRDAPSKNLDLTSRDQDLTELERELEASFIADIDSHHEIKTAVLGPESAPTVLMPRAATPAPTLRIKAPSAAHLQEPGSQDTEATSRLQGLSGDSIDMDLDRMASALGSDDTKEQPLAAEDVFSTEVFEASQRSKKVDLDVGEAMITADAPTNKMQSQTQAPTQKLKPVDLAVPEFEPVTMSEVGTKLDLARAYMDMGDPEGARSILEEVAQEGSASQKQEAARLIESLPG